MRYLRGQFLRACRLWLQTVPLPASGQKIFEYLHDSRQHGADLRLQTWFVISYHPPTMGNPLGEFFRALYYPLLRKVTPGGNASDARPDITDSLICPLENARRANATLLEV